MEEWVHEVQATGGAKEKREKKKDPYFQPKKEKKKKMSRAEKKKLKKQQDLTQNFSIEQHLSPMQGPNMMLFDEQQQLDPQERALIEKINKNPYDPNFARYASSVSPEKIPGPPEFMGKLPPELEAWEENYVHKRWGYGKDDI